MEHKLTQSDIHNFRLQNQKLEGKYKKALRDLMHVLQINKSLKQSIQNSSNHDSLQRSDLEGVKKKHNEQIQHYINQLQNLALKQINYQERIRELQDKNKEKQNAMMKVQKELKDALNRISQLDMQKTRREQQQYKSSHIQQEFQKQLSRLKEQNLEFRSQSAKHFKVIRKNEELQKQKQQLKDQIFELKEHIKDMTSQIYQERRKHCNQISEIQKYYLELRKQDTQKIKNIEFKFMTVQNELHNYKNVENYLQKQSISMKQEQELFNNIRDQIEKINGDWYKLDNEKAFQIAELKEKDMIQVQKIIELQMTIQKNKHQIKQYEQKIKILEKQAKEKQMVQQKFKTSESQKKQLLEKNYVLEALSLTQRHRTGQQVSQRIQQFQRRISILLDEKVTSSLEGSNSLQQIIILKGYIRQLSDILSECKRREDKLLHSRSSLKSKHKQIQEQYRIKLEAAKLKIAHYSNLVQKLYKFSEEKVRQKPFHQEKDAIVALQQYEKKMYSMSEEIIQLQKRIVGIQSINQDLQQQLNQAHRKHPSPAPQKISFMPDDGFTEERQQLQRIINKLQFNNAGLQAQNNNLLSQNDHLQKTLEVLEHNLAERQQIIISKDKIISGLTDEVSKLESTNYKRNTKQLSLMDMLTNYENKVAQLEQQLDNKNRLNNILNEKVNNLSINNQQANYQEPLSPLKQSSNYESQRSSQYLRDNIKQLQRNMYKQNEQIDNYKNIVVRLQEEIQTLKFNNQRLGLSQSNQDQDDLARRYEQQLRSIHNEKRNLEQAIMELRNQLQSLEEENRQNLIQLSRKQNLIKKQRDEITRLQIIEERQADIVRSTKDIMAEFEDINTSTLNKNSKQIDKLNATILTLRTTILSLQNQIKDKQAIISELKHQNYNLQLTKKKTSKQQNNQNNINYNGGNNLNEIQQNQVIQKLMGLLVMTGVQIDSLRSQNQKLLQKNGDATEQKDISFKKVQSANAKFEQAVQNNTSIENKMMNKQKSFNQDNCRVVTSYESVPSTIYSHVIYQHRPIYEQKVEQIPQKQQSSSNFDKKSSSEIGSKRSIKMIKMQARPSIEISSPLRTTVKNPP